jgi:beta-lactamase superfamily II metal-dependent hydrolase
MRVYFGKTSGSLRPIAGGKTKSVIWGDWLDVDGEEDPDHYRVNWKLAGGGTEPCLVRKEDCREQPLLEMMFLDVGQGDGCIVNVPGGEGHRTIIVDAGEGSNMHRFLGWRFRNLGGGGAFDTAVITHPDSDHYQGFQKIFDDEQVSFANVLHNGLVERKTERDSDILGRRERGFCVDVVETRVQLHALLSDPERRGGKLYPKLLWTALSNPGRFGNVAMASSEHGEKVDGKTYLPGFAPGGAGEARIEILGPVPEPGPGGRPALREFGDAPGDGKFNVGKTKNGHSVILRLEYGALSVIFGGDLNRPSEDYLLRHYGRIGDHDPLEDAVAGARARFSADVLKCCHHGSADVTEEFLEAVEPLAVVVSSGDQESHVHPRPEVLGLLGKKARGDRPILLCTEILRSTPESLELSDEEKGEHRALLDAIAVAAGAGQQRTARKAVEDFWEKKLRRLVSVYGAINVRTDGRKLILAFRKEAGARGGPWHIYEYAIGPHGWTLLDEVKPGH